MEASAAPMARYHPSPQHSCSGDHSSRRLMDEETFTENFNNVNWPRKTYLCYEVELPDGNSRVPPGWDKGFLRNKPIHMPGPPRDAEMRFLDLISSWNLDQKLRYRVTCFISWSPCADCAQRLAEFLWENSHVSLRIFASRIYTKGDYGAGLRTLQAAGAQIAIMASEEFEHCWETFVDHQGRPFQPWDELDPKSRYLSEQLQHILQPTAPPSLPPLYFPPSLPTLYFPPSHPVPGPSFRSLRGSSGYLVPPGWPAPCLPSLLTSSLLSQLPPPLSSSILVTAPHLCPLSTFPLPAPPGSTCSPSSQEQ
nr:DNA dC->dU-editing enzyme APOBEC-3G-like isoform X1 [Equus asinus]XP_044635532.1 DNA dC->dU-editing enzyme APOBEC-3G-like isoform X1 [Equus asinus]